MTPTPAHSTTPTVTPGHTPPLKCGPAPLPGLHFPRGYRNIKGRVVVFGSGNPRHRLRVLRRESQLDPTVRRSPSGTRGNSQTVRRGTTVTTVRRTE